MEDGRRQEGRDGSPNRESEIGDRRCLRPSVPLASWRPKRIKCFLWTHPASFKGVGEFRQGILDMKLHAA